MCSNFTVTSLPFSFDYNVSKWFVFFNFCLRSKEYPKWPKGPIFNVFLLLKVWKLYLTKVPTSEYFLFWFLDILNRENSIFEVQEVLVFFGIEIFQTLLKTAFRHLKYVALFDLTWSNKKSVVRKLKNLDRNRLFITQLFHYSTFLGSEWSSCIRRTAVDLKVQNRKWPYG